MPVNIGKLWGDQKFQRMDMLDKLLYIYLSTNPNLNVVGVLSPSIDVMIAELGCSKDHLRFATKGLRSLGYIHVKKFRGIVYFIIPEHFNKVPKAESSITRVQRDLDKLPVGLVKYLENIGITAGAKINPFKKPNSEEVSKYALSKGHLINGEEFIEFYEGKAELFGKKNIWVDGRGKEVRDWKAKLRRVWFKDENKLTEVKGAPKGYEYFYIMFEGKATLPDGWRNGKPYSKNIAVDFELKRQFNEKHGT
jgi:hypothetical protein